MRQRVDHVFKRKTWNLFEYIIKIICKQVAELPGIIILMKREKVIF